MLHHPSPECSRKSRFECHRHSLKRLPGTYVLKHTSLHGRSTTQRSLSLSSTTRSNDPWLSIQALLFFFTLWLEITSPDPHSLWEMLEQSLRNNTNRSGPDVSYPNEKAKTKTEAVCFSKNDDTGNYSDFSTSPDFLQSCTHTSQQQYLPIATLPVRESKEKPSLSPWSQIWLQEKALTFLVSPG